MKLKAVQSLPSIKLAGRVPGDLHADLITYAEYYQEANRSLAARGSDAADLHTLRSRLSGRGVVSTAQAPRPVSTGC